MSTELIDRIQTDTKAALKAGERESVSTLRMLTSALQQDQKLGEGDGVAVLQRERKKRIEAAEAYEKAGRDEQAAGERAEAELISTYLPAQLSDAELAEIVDAAVERTGASSQREMGKVMGAVMGQVKGNADGNRVSAMVRERLGA
ncbi:MAG: GatB/YqeY domain-containing protein [Solirubrobacterales bacterium]